MSALTAQPLARTGLANGAHVVVAPMAHARSVTIAVASRVGSGYESLAEQGVSHFVEHMLFKGTARRRSYAEIAAAIECLGGTLNAVTEPEMTILWARVASAHCATAIEVLGDMAGRALFAVEEIERERRVILDELSMLGDAPEETVRRSIRARLWPKHGVGREVAGPPRNVRQFSADQLRAHARRMFSGANLAICVAGNVDPADARAKVAKEFGWLPEGRRAAWPAIVDSAAPKPRVAIDSRDAEQVYFAVAGRALRRDDPGRYSMDLLCTALGEGMGSRLFAELRETRAIVYEVFSTLVAVRDSGAMTIEASTEPDTLEEAVKAVLTEVGRTRSGGVSSNELTRAREFVKGEILLSQEDSHAVAAWSAREELLETEPLTPDQVVVKYDEVTLEDVRRVARRVFTDQWAILAASGPIDENAPLPIGFDGQLAAPE